MVLKGSRNLLAHIASVENGRYTNLKLRARADAMLRGL